MFCHKCKCCTFSWFSGFFALPALVHLVRLVTKTQVQIGDWIVPMSFSIGTMVVAGVLSLVLCKTACKACACSAK